MVFDINLFLNKHFLYLNLICYNWRINVLLKGVFMSNIEMYKDVNELRKSGFYDLSEPDQMKFLKENGFYEMSN